MLSFISLLKVFFQKYLLSDKVSYYYNFTKCLKNDVIKMRGGDERGSEKENPWKRDR